MVINRTGRSTKVVRTVWQGPSHDSDKAKDAQGALVVPDESVRGVLRDTPLLRWLVS